MPRDIPIELVDVARGPYLVEFGYGIIIFNADVILVLNAFSSLIG